MYNKTQSKLIIMTFMASLLFVMTNYVMAFAQSDNNSVTTGYSLYDLLVAAQSGKMNMTITDLHGFPSSSGNYLYIIGNVTNHDWRPFEFVKATIDLYDKENKWLGSDDTYVTNSGEVLASNSSHTFKAMIGGDDIYTGNITNIANYRVSLNAKVAVELR
jgi:hypothetical protein